MQINKLRLSNYKQFKNLEISFTEGLTGLIGSNGSGKSTILEALVFALYGKSTNAKEDIRNDYAAAKETVEVEVEFYDKGKDYRVIRLLKGKNLTASAELYCGDILSASQTTEVNKQILKLLKIDYKNFKRSYFSEQKDVTALLSMRKGERQFEIRKMLGLEKLDKLEDRIKESTKEHRVKIALKKEQLLGEERICEIEKEKSNLEQSRYSTEESHKNISKESQEAKESYQKIKEELSRYETRRDKHQNLEKELSVTRTDISSLDGQIHSGCEELSVLNQKKEALSDLLPLKEKYELLNEELHNMLNQEAKYTRVSALQSAVKQCEEIISDKNGQIRSKEAEINDILPLESELREKAIRLSSKEELIIAKNVIRDSLKEHISGAETQSDQKQKRLLHIKTLGKNSVCPECERPLNEHYDKLVEEYEARISEYLIFVTNKKGDLAVVESEIKKLTSEKDSLTADIKSIELKFSRVKIFQKDIQQLSSEILKTEQRIKKTQQEIESIGEVCFDPERLAFLREEEKKHKPFNLQFNELSVEVKNIPLLEKKLDGFRSRKNILLKSETDLLDQLRFNGYEEDEYNSLKEDCRIKEQLKDELQLRFFNIDSELKGIIRQLNIIIDALRKDEQSRNEIRSDEEEVLLYDRLAVFINSFKQRVASQEMPAISLEASRLFSNITHGRYSDLVIDSDYEIYVNRDANKVLLDTLSGGEKDLAGLCLRIAISKRIAALAGRESMGFLALDEVFGSQDETRREELMHALYQISHDFKQIFVISHNEDVKEAFPNRLHVRKEGKYSVIVAD